GRAPPADPGARPVTAGACASPPPTATHPTVPEARFADVTPVRIRMTKEVGKFLPACTGSGCASAPWPRAGVRPTHPAHDGRRPAPWAAMARDRRSIMPPGQIFMRVLSNLDDRFPISGIFLEMPASSLGACPSPGDAGGRSEPV